MASTVELRVYKNDKPLPAVGPTGPMGPLGSIQHFLDRYYPIQLDWTDERLECMVLVEHNVFHGRSMTVSGQRIVGVSGMVCHDTNKVHVYVLAIIKDMQRQGLGTRLLKQIALTYPTSEVTISVAFEEAHLIDFYCRRGYATQKEINVQLKVIVLSLVQLKLLHDVPLP